MSRVLEDLGVTSKNVNDVEHQVVEQQLALENERRDSKEGRSKDEDIEEMKVISKEQLQMNEIEQEVSTIQFLLENDDTNSRLQQSLLEKRLKELKGKQQMLQQQIELQDNTQNIVQIKEGTVSTQMMETERDRMIRQGLITPFDDIEGFDKGLEDSKQIEVEIQEGPLSPRMQRAIDKFNQSRENQPRTILLDIKDMPKTEQEVRRIQPYFWRQSNAKNTDKKAGTKRRAHTLERKRKSKKQKVVPKNKSKTRKKQSQNQVQSILEEDDDDEVVDTDNSNSNFEDELLNGVFDDDSEDQSKKRTNKQKSEISQESQSDSDEEDLDQENEQEEEHDDFVQSDYDERLKLFHEHQKFIESEEPDSIIELQGGFKIQKNMYDSLFAYQRTGVKWLWELHSQKTGGIIGDEMGLGKTVQICAFLDGLRLSGLFSPSLVVCPATTLQQWTRELHKWCPYLRVVVLHDSMRIDGTGVKKGIKKLVKCVMDSEFGILLTTYESLRLKAQILLKPQWGYAILDEGHKIRNPDAGVTVVVKQLCTPHRILMSGTPIQNRLEELWSLFDFVFPGKLGTLPVFRGQFAVPIQLGGYKNASQLQASAAYRCALVLRDLISPYLLRRRKKDVEAQLPKKTEQVLFCKLTKDQRQLYKSYVSSSDVLEICDGRRNALQGIDVLRKICNHPHLLERNVAENLDEYGDPKLCGKLQVCLKILEHWHREGHKALLFCQTQQMLDILEKSVQNVGYTYHRMDGVTGVKTRFRMVDDFNAKKEIFLFLLTTRVGGLGLNLTGASKVMIYDPDWNPSTDAQARERAWRIGQKLEVTVYRLITGGTIEEKVYHRQIFKQFLTNKILQDPRQKRFFAARDIKELFTLNDGVEDGETETADLFNSIDGHIVQEPAENNNSNEPHNSSSNLNSNSNESNPNEKSQECETKILKDLLDGGSVVHSAMDHDKIEGANDQERFIIQKEAIQIAEQAAAALKKCRRELESAPIHEPTWTGRSGSAGAPDRKFGNTFSAHIQNSKINSGSTFGGSGLPASNGKVLHSSSILDKLRKRMQGEIEDDGDKNNNIGGRKVISPWAEKIAGEIVQFLLCKGGRASSDQVVSYFNKRIGNSDQFLFKQLLKQVADFEGRSKGWLLKKEFKTN